MTSDQFITWLEGKLADVGVQKVVPDQAALQNAYRRAVRQRRVQAAIEEALAYIDDDEEMPIPDDLATRINEALDGSAHPWDRVLWTLVADGGLDAHGPR
jgi:hypothetical protein